MTRTNHRLKPAPLRIKGRAAASRTPAKGTVPVENITRSILIFRGQKILLDRDLAAVYGVNTGRLNEAVKRNAKRFPEDFVFRLTVDEVAALRSQNAILEKGRGRGWTWGIVDVPIERFFGPAERINITVPAGCSSK